MISTGLPSGGSSRSRLVVNVAGCHERPEDLEFPIMRLLSCCILAALANLNAAPFSGRWIGQMNAGDNTTSMFLDLHDDDSLTGDVALGDDSNWKTISDPQLFRNELSFAVRG